MTDARNDRVRRARQSPKYAAERAALTFLEGIWTLIREKGMTQREVASALGKSPAYVSKLLSGPTNITIETAAHLAHAVGGRVSLTVSPVVHSALKSDAAVNVHSIENAMNFRAGSRGAVRTGRGSLAGSPHGSAIEAIIRDVPVIASNEVLVIRPPVRRAA